MQVGVPVGCQSDQRHNDKVQRSVDVGMLHHHQPLLITMGTELDGINIGGEETAVSLVFTGLRT